MGSSAAEAFLRPTVVGMVRSGTTTTGSSSSSTTPPVAGIMPITSSRRAVSEPAHAAVAGVLEAADLAVSQPVVDEREDLASDRDAGLVDAAALAIARYLADRTGPPG
jgi:hypothetical protein